MAVDALADKLLLLVSEGSQEVRRVVELMDRYGVGLEQEILLLSIQGILPS
jgi:hypothetical protein